MNFKKKAWISIGTITVVVMVLFITLFIPIHKECAVYNRDGTCFRYGNYNVYGYDLSYLGASTYVFLLILILFFTTLLIVTYLEYKEVEE